MQKNFQNREELYNAGLHNSYQKGIGKSKDGSGNMTIVLSGGYIDDEDFGDTIIYTGEGGRDPGSGKQVEDQVISGGNKDLIKAFESNQHVYVVRGHQHKSEHSPAKGYELAGVYRIDNHWIEKGRDGFDIIRFKLVQESESSNSNNQYTLKSQARVQYVANRVVRETKLATSIKDIYEHKCQVCRETIKLPTGNRYAEAAHIIPLGEPHNGPDAIENLLCLCPNHHLMFDKYCFSINPESLELEGLEGVLFVDEEHKINPEYLDFHFQNYLKHQSN